MSKNSILYCMCDCYYLHGVVNYWSWPCGRLLFYVFGLVRKKSMERHICIDCRLHSGCFHILSRLYHRWRSRVCFYLGFWECLLWVDCWVTYQLDRCHMLCPNSPHNLKMVLPRIISPNVRTKTQQKIPWIWKSLNQQWLEIPIPDPSMPRFPL